MSRPLLPRIIRRRRRIPVVVLNKFLTIIGWESLRFRSRRRLYSDVSGRLPAQAHIHSSPLGCSRCMQLRLATKVSEKTKHTLKQTYQVYTVSRGSKRYYNHTDVVVYDCVCQASTNNHFGCIFCIYYCNVYMIRYIYYNSCSENE